MKELFKVMKDHSNGFMQDLVTSSYQHCFISEARKFLEDPDDMDVEWNMKERQKTILVWLIYIL